MRILAALLALALLSGAVADEAGPFQVRWNTSSDAILQYRVSPPAAAPDPKPAARDLRHFGFQVAPKGPSSRNVTKIEEVGDPVVLAMPPDGTKVGGRWRASYEFENIRGYSEFELRGGYRLRGWVELDGKKYLEVDGVFEGTPLRRPKPRIAPGYRFKSGKLTSLARIDPETGRVHAASVSYDLQFSTDGGSAPYVSSWEYEFADTWVVPEDEFQAAIDKAVEKGVAWLRTKQLDDGSFSKDETYGMGWTSLCLLALLKSGVPRFDPAIEKGFDSMKELAFTRTYSVALLILALEARHAPTKENPVGGTVLAGGKLRIPDKDLDWMRRAAKWLIDNRATNGLWHYPTPEAPATYDYSNTQYAVLALKTASRCGIEVPAEVWSKVVEQCLAAQEPSGPVVGLDRLLAGATGNEEYAGSREYVREAQARGWGYVAGQEGYGSMTTAGIACLVLAESGLYDLGRLDRQTRTKIDASVRDGLAWLGRHYSVFENPLHGGWYYYYLYGLERAMILSRTHTISGRDWYKDGARILLKLHEGDGSWGPRSVDGTCFALLFLRRATTPVAIATGG